MERSTTVTAQLLSRWNQVSNVQSSAMTTCPGWTDVRASGKWRISLVQVSPISMSPVSSTKTVHLAWREASKNVNAFAQCWKAKPMAMKSNQSTRAITSSILDQHARNRAPRDTNSRAKDGTGRKSARSRGTYRAGAIRAIGNIVLKSNTSAIILLEQFYSVTWATIHHVKPYVL